MVTDYGSFEFPPGGSGGGGGSGTVTSVAVASDTLTISGSPITTSGTIHVDATGLANAFAGFDGSGNLYSVPGWTADSTGQVQAFLVSTGSTSATSFQLGATISDPLSGGYEGVIVSADLSSTMAFMSCYNAENTFEPTFNISGGIGIYQDQSQFLAGAVASNYTSFSAIPQLAGSLSGFTGFNSSPSFQTGYANSGGTIGLNEGSQFESGSSSSYYSALQLSPNIQSGASIPNVTGVSISPNLNGTISNSFQGISINPSGAAVIPNAQGINISLSNITTSDPQGPLGIQSDSRVSINAETQLMSGLGFQIGNRIESLLHVAAGFPVTGTDSLGNDFAGDLEAEDDLAAGPIGLGWTSVGFIADMAVAVGKTVETVNVFLPAVALPDPGFITGGHVDNMSFIRMFTPLSQGGSITVDNLYSVKLDPVFGNLTSVATNAWGIWIGDTTADNWFAKNVVVGGTTGKAVGSSVLSIRGHYGSNQATAPVAVVQAGAGTGATSSVSHATDTAGIINLTTGTVTLAAGAQSIVTFNVAYATAPIVVLTPNNAVTGLTAVGAYVTSTTTTFTLNFGAAGILNTAYSWNYHILETQ